MIWILCLFWREGDICNRIIRSLRTYNSIYRYIPACFTRSRVLQGRSIAGFWTFLPTEYNNILYVLTLNSIALSYRTVYNILRCSSSSTYRYNCAVDRRVFTSRGAVTITEGLKRNDRIARLYYYWVRAHCTV